MYTPFWNGRQYLSTNRRRRDEITQIAANRTERIPDHLPLDRGNDRENVGTIVTAENQERLERGMEYLAKAPVVARGLTNSSRSWLRRI